MQVIAGWSRKIISIEPNWRILDVGSGHHPYDWATFHIEKYLKEDGHKQRTAPLVRVSSLICGDILYSPFRDKEFDYCIMTHIAEHIDDPDTFCEEINRICKAGYIETPSEIGEAFLGNRVHKWIVTVKDNRLIFKPKKEHFPYGDLVDRLWKTAGVGGQMRAIAFAHPELIWTQFEFKNSFEWEISR